MTKIRPDHLFKDLEIEESIWDDWEGPGPEEEFWQDDNVSWQWDWTYYQLSRLGWTYVRIDHAYKYHTVVTWLNSLGADYRHERRHFMIKDPNVATITALKFS